VQAAAVVRVAVAAVASCQKLWCRPRVAVVAARINSEIL
jgi:hypothetical protein